MFQKHFIDHEAELLDSIYCSKSWNGHQKYNKNKICFTLNIQLNFTLCVTYCVTFLIPSQKAFISEQKTWNNGLKTRLDFEGLEFGVANLSVFIKYHLKSVMNFC